MVDAAVGAAVDTAVAPTDAASPQALAVGTPVDVRSRYVGAWSRGFEVAESVKQGYRVRRLSDGSILPDVFASEDVRAQRHKHGQWWY
jgi:hypothetical protein